ncbi:MAG: HPr(Ser) kinase/phosphatase [Acidobacteriia bacterium]|nr:HPr(Ser) kinase/phosphatase [Terriglobia bacterium]
MLEQEGSQPESITVAEFALAPELGLELDVIYGGEGMAHQIRSPRIQKLGLALAGYTDYIHPDRVQLLGGSEMNYLRILEPAACEKSIRRLGRLKICCIVITKGLDVPPGFLELARESGIALLRTAALSSVAIRRISDFLEVRLAPRTTIHGVFIEVFGLGVLILGPSGIGKSECALELVLRGHRLIADDSVEITRRGINGLIGAGGPVLKHHMELRGLGIIDIKELFGVSATGQTHALDLVVRLERWKPEGEYDRLGLDRPTVEILGVPMPVIEMPVAPGRNVSTLVEVAARTQLLRKRGYQLSGELLGSETGSGSPC